MAQNDHAVVVGINKYPDLGNLYGPENDAQEFSDWLLSPIGGNVPSKNVQLIKSSDYAAASQASSAMPNEIHVDSALEPLHAGLKDLSTGRTGRRLYIFLAGHGFAPTFLDSALLMANATSPLGIGHHISGLWYSEWFLRAAVFEEIIVFMDCCRDEYPLGSTRNPPWQPQAGRGSSSTWFHGFATKWARRTRERKDERGQITGLFSRALLSALKSGPISALELKGYVFNYLQELLQEDEYIEPEFRGHDDIRFSEDAVETAKKVVITFLRPQQGETVELLDHKISLVGTHAVQDGPWHVALPFGAYVVRVPHTNRQVKFEVYGEEVHVRF